MWPRASLACPPSLGTCTLRLPPSPGWSSPASPQIPIRAPRQQEVFSTTADPWSLCPSAATATVSDIRTSPESFVALHFCPNLCFLPRRVGDWLVPSISAWDGELNVPSNCHATHSWCLARSPSVSPSSSPHHPSIPPSTTAQAMLSHSQLKQAVQQVPNSRLGQTHVGENKLSP